VSSKTVKIIGNIFALIGNTFSSLFLDRFVFGLFPKNCLNRSVSTRVATLGNTRFLQATYRRDGVFIGAAFLWQHFGNIKNKADKPHY
jgi:hypothetical protein